MAETCHPKTERIEGGHAIQCGTCGDWYDVPCNCPMNNRDPKFQHIIGGVVHEADCCALRAGADSCCCKSGAVADVGGRSGARPTLEVSEPTEGVTYLPIAKMFDEGLLFAINRTVLHPLGYALEISVDEEHPEHCVMRVWDCSDDPDGIRYEVPTEVWQQRTEAFTKLWDERTPERFNHLGYIVQLEP